MIDKSFVLAALYDQIEYNLNNNQGLLIKEDLRILKSLTKDKHLSYLINDAMEAIDGTLLDEDAIEDVDQVANYIS